MLSLNSKPKLPLLDKARGLLKDTYFAWYIKMPSIDSVVEQPPSEVDATKREAENGDSSVGNVEQPPAKKARVDNPNDPEEQAAYERARGIAPIKAEYDLRSF